mmetsp:Transcript_39900/g.113962  ORF Transcript_39900/g.113962 Transcript_39900/m.113962 type:complete len:406 (-) Transcript_39900:70-1287(-)
MVLVRSIQAEAWNGTTVTALDELDVQHILALVVTDVTGIGLGRSGHKNPVLQADSIFIFCMVNYFLISLFWTWYFVLRRQVPDSKMLPRVYPVLLCMTWCLTSVCMHMLNKSVVDRTKTPALVTVLQMVIAVVVMVPVAAWHLFHIRGRQLLWWLPVPFLFAAVLCTSSYTYKYISLSLLTIVRNLTPLVVLPIEMLIMGDDKKPKTSSLVWIALMMMVAGTVVYAGGIHGFSGAGVALAFANMGLAVTDRFLQRRLLTEECKDMDSSVCALINNSLGILPLLVVVHAGHDLQIAHANKVLNNPYTLLLLMLSGIAGLAICYLGFECQRAISVTSFYVLQNASKIGLVTVGILFFKDPIHSPGPIVGLVLSLSGSLLYGRIQLPTGQSASKQPLDVTDASTARAK